MLEAGGDPDFAEESVRAERGGELGPEDLDRDLTLVLEVPGQEDRRHPALTDLAVEDIPVSQGGSQQFDGCGQRGASN
jgi:hypothetical protein